MMYVRVKTKLLEKIIARSKIRHAVVSAYQSNEYIISNCHSLLWVNILTQLSTVHCMVMLCMM